jgi:hypothetical protein
MDKKVKALIDSRTLPLHVGSEATLKKKLIEVERLGWEVNRKRSFIILRREDEALLYKAVENRFTLVASYEGGRVTIRSPKPGAPSVTLPVETLGEVFTHLL